MSTGTAPERTAPETGGGVPATGRRGEAYRLTNRTIVATAIASATGAAALPVWGAGVGWTLAALAIAAVVTVARLDADGGGARRGRRRGGRDRKHYGERAWRLAAGVAALAFAAVPAVRAAGWLVVLCLIAGLALASYALAGGVTWRALALSAAALPLASARGLAWTARTGAGGARSGRPTRVGAVIAAVGAGIVLTLVFGALFRAADPVFAAIVDGWIRGISATSLARAALGCGLVAGCAIGAVGLTVKPESGRWTVNPGEGATAVPVERSYLTLAEWTIPLVLLDLLFVLFVWVQLTVLFAGDEYVLRDNGPDYAVYARSGFVELCAVTLLTLAVVSALTVWAGRTTGLERGLLRTLGGVLCLLTIVIVASALKRLGLYAGAYGFTVPRLLAYAGEVWLGLVFALITIAGVPLRASWLPRATLAAGLAILLALAAINPEAVMARTVLSRLATEYPVDYAHLSTFSADAIDEIDRLPEPQRSCVLARLATDLANPDPWYALNLGRQHARDVLARTPNRPCQPPIADMGRAG